MSEEAATARPDPAAARAGDAPARSDPAIEKRPHEALPRALRRVFNLDDFERVARRKLPRGVYSYVAGGSDDTVAMARNRADFDAVRLMPRVLGGHGTRDQRTTLFGRTYAHPFGISPMGLSALAAYDGDVALAKGAAAAGIPAVMSATSLTAMERVAAEGPSRWYQAYLPGDDARVVPMVERIAAAGYEVLVMTGDVPVAGNREDSKRDNFGAPMKPSLDLFLQGATRPGWVFGTFARTLLTHGVPHFENQDVTRGPPIVARDVVRSFAGRATLSWHHAELVRRTFPGKLVIKGVIAPEDAARARDIGADGIVVSNHGGRQLDGSLSAIAALPAVKAAAGDMAVMLDSGVRRGSDVLRALALGADFAFVGRPFLFAAAVAGTLGVRHAAAILAAEVDRDMAMLGLGSLAALDAGILAPASRSRRG
ncbi:alpha-hydroxy acid oxidase [Acuticoccus sp. I52.16.1]|uniref:alpha-hydroxy acid oxidase n=1 Tax=Acuticoccus sp. I52.16.1 TaxID=2928472 RepID=UPI001FD5FC35|nr:alpha-hydroxy acid oxidase [Acuticoccus sp. I52.16.1]UOM35793.1 alpha-hydroxy-acid oxidizing protein [Acuticoccus sp. I52.16.1]